MNAAELLYHVPSEKSIRVTAVEYPDTEKLREELATGIANKNDLLEYYPNPTERWMGGTTNGP